MVYSLDDQINRASLLPRYKICASFRTVFSERPPFWWNDLNCFTDYKKPNLQFLTEIISESSGPIPSVTKCETHSD